MALVLMILLATATSVGQFLVKKGVNSGITFYKNPFIITGGLLVVSTPLLYIRVVKILGLSNAYGLNGLSYIMVFLLGTLMLKERTNRYRTAGVILIAIGVFIWSI